MDTILILAKQITIMFLLMALGWIMAKGGLLTPQGAKDLSHLLLRFVVPAIIIQSFLVERTPERVHDFFWSFVLSFLVISFSVLVSKVLFRRPGHVIDHFGSAFCNAGFFGIPLVQAFLGEGAVFYIASFVMMIFFFQWTYGVYQFTRDRSMFRFRRLITNPVLIAFLIALILFFVQIPVPEILTAPLGMISGLNTPIAMIILGSYLAKDRLIGIFTDRRAYGPVAVRLVLIPLLTIGLLTFLPDSLSTVRLAILIPSVAPIGANVAVFAGLYDQDYGKAVRLVCLSTLSSLITIPLLVTLAQWLW
jgi:hypothetical protein